MQENDMQETSFPKMDRNYAQTELLKQRWDGDKEVPGPHTSCVAHECVRVDTNKGYTVAAIQNSSNCQTTLRISAYYNVTEPDLCSQNEAGTSTLEQLCINHQVRKEAATTKESSHLLVPPGRAMNPA